VFLHAGLGRVDAHLVDERLREQRVSPEARRLRDGVLEQSVGHDDVGPDQLAVAEDLVDRPLAVVHEELQRQVRDPPACVALAGRQALDRPLPKLEREVAALDHAKQVFTARVRLVGREAEHGVALELRQLHERPKLPHDHRQQVREDVVRMLELHPSQVRAVPADVCERERSPFECHARQRCYRSRGDR
jgi:hypothetical protein